MIDFVNTWLPMITFLGGLIGIIWRAVTSVKTMVEKLSHGIDTLNNTIKEMIIDIKENKENIKEHDKEITNIKVDIAEIKATLNSQRGD